MKIESVSNSNMTYQGSVSVKEAAPVSAEMAVESSAAPVRECADAPETAVPQQSYIQANGEEQTNAKVGTEAMKKAVEEINRNAKNSEAVFGIHDATNRVTIKIVDKESKKVIKEFPPEKTLDMIAKVWEMAGLMVDEKR